jgi:hypothetical protein
MRVGHICTLALLVGCIAAAAPVTSVRAQPLGTHIVKDIAGGAGVSSGRTL